MASNDYITRTELLAALDAALDAVGNALVGRSSLRKLATDAARRALNGATVLDASALVPLLRCLKKESHLGLWDMVPAEWQALVDP